MRLRILLAALVMAAALPSAASAATVRWHACLDANPGARCGTLAVPLDRGVPGRGTIGIGFELYPRRLGNRPSLGTIVSIEGGPGFATTVSRDSRIELAGTLLDRRDLLLLDLRGTGLSNVLSCPAFLLTTLDYVERAGRCARQIGPDRDLYDTHQAAEDLADLLAALRVPQGTVDLYGDSYGTYFAQTFAARHGGFLHTLVLDGAYPTPGTDPLWGDLARAVQRGFRLACARSAGCATSGTDPIAAIAALVAGVRQHPISGTAPDGDGNPVAVTVDEMAITLLVQATYYDTAAYRDLLAAIRSHAVGDDAPLLRLAAETGSIDAGAQDLRSSSEALYLAVICHDYPQPWDVNASFAARRDQLALARSLADPAAFSPISVLSWTSTAYEGVDACLEWPAPAHADPPTPANPTWPSVPTLVLNGDLDTITPSEDARIVAARFPHSTFVEVANSVHVTALSDRDACASAIYRRFVATGATGDTSCAANVAPVRLIDRFPRTADEATPATSAAGDRSTLLERQVSAVAAATVADAIQRWQLNYSGASVGLRGGTWSYVDDANVETFTFADARFALDVGVTGSATWDTRGGGMTAAITIRGPRGTRGNLSLAWSMQGPAAVATIAGKLDGHVVRLTMPAP
jgi:pimeloyl-ACP methyl ester carboxylesterase